MKASSYKEYKEGKYTVRAWCDGDKVWWFEGKVHRENGPAWEFNDGSKRWFLDNMEYTEKVWKKRTRRRKLKVLGI